MTCWDLGHTFTWGGSASGDVAPLSLRCQCGFLCRGDLPAEATLAEVARLHVENEELRAEQEDDRRAWSRDSVAWELAVEGLKEENARLQAERDGARRLGAYTAKRYVGLLEQLVPISAENERLRLLLGDNSLTTYDPETGCARCGCPTLVDDRCWGCKRRVVE